MHKKAGLAAVRWDKIDNRPWKHKAELQEMNSGAQKQGRTNNWPLDNER